MVPEISIPRLYFTNINLRTIMRSQNVILKVVSSSEFKKLFLSHTIITLGFPCCW
jgi:hypothetical protein